MIPGRRGRGLGRQYLCKIELWSWTGSPPRDLCLCFWKDTKLQFIAPKYTIFGTTLHCLCAFDKFIFDWKTILTDHILPPWPPPVWPQGHTSSPTASPSLFTKGATSSLSWSHWKFERRHQLTKTRVRIWITECMMTAAGRQQRRSVCTAEWSYRAWWLAPGVRPKLALQPDGGHCCLLPPSLLPPPPSNFYVPLPTRTTPDFLLSFGKDTNIFYGLFY